MSTTTTTPATLCPCGKPAEHVDAHPDSPAWPCRVPVAEAPSAEQRATTDPDVLVAVALHSIRQRGDCAAAFGAEPVAQREHAALWHDTGRGFRVYIEERGDGYTLSQAQALQAQLAELLGEAERITGAPRVA